jgi:hypothetical protein
MKKNFLLSISLTVLVFSACKKESSVSAESQKAEVLGPPIIITTATGTCSANPFVYPSPGVSVNLNSLSHSFWISGPGAVKVWVKKNSSLTWSSYVMSTPKPNPFRVPFSAFSPALGPIAAGTPMNVAITANPAATCPTIACGGAAVSNYANFTASNCTIISDPK